MKSISKKKIGVEGSGTSPVLTLLSILFAYPAWDRMHRELYMEILYGTSSPIQYGRFVSEKLHHEKNK